MILVDGKVMLGLPCDELTEVPNLFPEPVRRILATSPDRSAFLLSCAQGNFCIYEPQTQSVYALDERIRATERASYSWSPTGAYLAMTHVLSMQGAFEMATYLVNVHTAQVEDVVSWRHRGAEGSFSGPIWLAENRFLIQEALETGPLLVTIGQDPIQVAPELFGRPTSPKCEQEPCGTFLAATGAPVAGTQTYHIVLYQVGTASEDRELLLYHSESKKVEGLPFQEQGGLSPDGRSLVLYNSEWDAISEQPLYELSLLPVDSQAHFLATQYGNPLPLSWSPDGTMVAFSTAGGMRLFSSDTGALVGSWDTGGYSTFPGSWSPNGKSLAVQGYLPQGQGQALFVIQVPTN